MEDVYVAEVWPLDEAVSRLQSNISTLAKGLEAEAELKLEASRFVESVLRSRNGDGADIRAFNRFETVFSAVYENDFPRDPVWFDGRDLVADTIQLMNFLHHRLHGAEEGESGSGLDDYRAWVRIRELAGALRERINAQLQAREIVSRDFVTYEVGRVRMTASWAAQFHDALRVTLFHNPLCKRGTLRAPFAWKDLFPNPELLPALNQTYRQFLYFWQAAGIRDSATVLAFNRLHAELDRQAVVSAKLTGSMKFYLEHTKIIDDRSRVRFVVSELELPELKDDEQGFELRVEMEKTLSLIDGNALQVRHALASTALLKHSPGTSDSLELNFPARLLNEAIGQLEPLSFFPPSRLRLGLYRIDGKGEEHEVGYLYLPFKRSLENPSLTRLNLIALYPPNERYGLGHVKGYDLGHFESDSVDRSFHLYLEEIDRAAPQVEVALNERWARSFHVGAPGEEEAATRWGKDTRILARMHLQFLISR
ncbi:MAG: hypothetical protein AB7P04_10700 [Bacteriovoracia bacterium]